MNPESWHGKQMPPSPLQVGQTSQSLLPIALPHTPQLSILPRTRTRCVEVTKAMLCEYAPHPEHTAAGGRLAIVLPCSVNLIAEAEAGRCPLRPTSPKLSTLSVGSGLAGLTLQRPALSREKRGRVNCPQSRRPQSVSPPLRGWLDSVCLQYIGDRSATDPILQSLPRI